MIALNILKVLKGFVFILAIALLNGADGQLKPRPDFRILG